MVRVGDFSVDVQVGGQALPVHMNTVQEAHVLVQLDTPFSRTAEFAEVDPYVRSQYLPPTPLRVQRQACATRMAMDLLTERFTLYTFTPGA